MSYSRTLKLSVFFLIQFLILFVTTYFNFFDLQIWNYYVSNTFFNTYLTILITSLLYGFMILGYIVWAIGTCCWNEHPFENIFKFSWISLLIIIAYYSSITYAGFSELINHTKLEEPFDLMYQLITWGGLGNIGLTFIWTLIERCSSCFKSNNSNYNKFEDDK